MSHPALVPAFDHERLAVYQRAVDFVASAHAIRSNLAKGRGGLADQLERAAISIPLNIAEGAGEFSKREKVRFYRIARRSATECAAILDIALRIGAGDRGAIESARQQLVEVVSMLVGLARRMETGER